MTVYCNHGKSCSSYFAGEKSDSHMGTKQLKGLKRIVHLCSCFLCFFVLPLLPFLPPPHTRSSLLFHLFWKCTYSAPLILASMWRGIHDSNVPGFSPLLCLLKHISNWLAWEQGLVMHRSALSSVFVLWRWVLRGEYLPPASACTMPTAGPPLDRPSLLAQCVTGVGKAHLIIVLSLIKEPAAYRDKYFSCCLYKVMF